MSADRDHDVDVHAFHANDEISMIHARPRKAMVIHAVSGQA